jgi:hypothetical protein
MRRVARLLTIVALLATGCGSSTTSPSPTSPNGDAASPSTRPTTAPAASPTRAIGSSTTTPSGGVAAAPSTYEDAPCPADIDARALSEHSCGILTVPEDRTKTGGPTIRLVVVRTPTTVPTPRSWTGAAFGGDIGLFTPSVTAEGAERTKANQVHLATRGLDRSDPNLGCPEIADLDVASAEAASHDAAFTSQFVAAVAACRARLTASGIDVARYGVEDAAADLEDLRVALGIDSWLLDTKGDASVYTFAYLRHWPEHVGQVVIDSPRFPGDGPADDAVATDYAWARYVDACRASRRCSRLLPDPTAALKAAVARLDTTPIVVQIADSALTKKAGRPIRLVVDGDKLLRVVRSVLGGDGPRSIPGLATAIVAAGDGRLDEAFRYPLASDSTLCLGFLPECPRASTFSWGAYLTVMCADVLPFAGTRPPPSGDEPGFARLLDGGGPLRDACPAWGVAAADSSVGRTPAVATPILAYTGELDAWSARPLVERHAASLPELSYYELAGQTHNVMGYTSCSVTMRNAWLDHPADPPPDTGCLRDLRAVVDPSD